jgi:deferrochelatase/peroxidase EfeB
MTDVVFDSFGFEDGISQPLMDGIDKLEPNVLEPNSTGWAKNMNTDLELLIVTKDTAKEGGDSRPDWMYDGSFLVFRKLEQDVKAFQVLTSRYEEVDCGSPGLLSAKLMGRWPSGKCYMIASVLCLVLSMNKY